MLFQRFTFALFPPRLANCGQWSTVGTTAANGGHLGLMSRNGSNFTDRGHRLAGSHQGILRTLVDVIVIDGVAVAAATVAIAVTTRHGAVRSESVTTVATIIVTILDAEAKAKRKCTWRRKHVEPLLLMMLLWLLLLLLLLLLL